MECQLPFALQHDDARARLADQRLFADEKESLAAQIAAHKRAVALADENTLMARPTCRRRRLLRRWLAARRAWWCARRQVSDKLRQLQTQLATNEATEMLFVQQQATLNRIASAAVHAKAAAVPVLLSTRNTRTHEQTNTHPPTGGLRSGDRRRRGRADDWCAARSRSVAPCRTVLHCVGVAPWRTAVQRGNLSTHAGYFRPPVRVALRCSSLGFCARRGR